MEKNYVILCHRLQSHLSSPGRVRGAQGGLDKLIFKRSPGSEVPPQTTIKTRDEAAYEASSNKKPLDATIANRTPYLHLGSKEIKKYG